MLPTSPGETVSFVGTGASPVDVPPLEALPTLEALLFEPARLRGWIAKGAPCSTSFVPFTVPTRSMG